MKSTIKYIFALFILISGIQVLPADDLNPFSAILNEIRIPTTPLKVRQSFAKDEPWQTSEQSFGSEHYQIAMPSKTNAVAHYEVHILDQILAFGVLRDQNNHLLAVINPSMFDFDNPLEVYNQLLSLPKDLREQYKVTTHHEGGLFFLDCEWEKQSENLPGPVSRVIDDVETIANKMRLVFSEGNVFVLLTTYAKGSPEFHASFVESFKILPTNE